MAHRDGASGYANATASGGAPLSPIHSCEICGASGFSDDEMREHTRTCHVEGNAQCPFCGLVGVTPAELLLHVNQAHLDYLTPENELMSFIDDQSPNSYFSFDGDSDSIYDGRGAIASPTPSIEHNHSKTNGSLTNLNHSNGLHNGAGCSSVNTNVNLDARSALSNPRKSMAKQTSNCDNVNESGKDSSAISTFEVPTNGTAGGKGSPLRTQLGLKLKPHKPATTKISPLLCPICEFTSDFPSVLEEHINRSHFDPLSPSINHQSASYSSPNKTLTALQCPICMRSFESSSDLELHVNIEHRDILSPAKAEHRNDCEDPMANGSSQSVTMCPVCFMSLSNMKTQEIEVHIEGHFPMSPNVKNPKPDVEMQAQKLREQREFEMLRAQYGMDDQGNFREQSAAAMQRAVYAGEMSVADYYERQVGLRAAESHGIDDGTSCTKSVAARALSISSASQGVIRTLICSGVDHYASSYGDKGWGCGYRNLQMLISSMLHNTSFNEALYSAWGTNGPSRTAMPSISRLQKMVEAAWTQGFDVQGSEQLGCKLYNTRKWIGATEIMTVLCWLRINCELVDFHRPTALDGRHPDLFNWVLRYFEEPRVHTPPLYLQHQGHSRTIIGIEQRTTGLTLLILDPSHGPKQVAALGGSQDSLRLIRRGPSAMRAPQYQIVAVRGLIETEEQYQASKVLRSLRIPPEL